MRNININSYDKTIETFTKIYRPKSLTGIKRIFRSAKKIKKKLVSGEMANLMAINPLLHQI